MPLAGEMRIADHIVVDGRAGLLHIDKRERISLVSRSGNVKLQPTTEVKRAIGKPRATDLLTALATPKSNAKADAALIEEIGFELELSTRVTRAIIRRCDGTIDKPEGPDAYTDHEYLGSFVVKDELVIADRVQVASTDKTLAIATPAWPGRWHAFFRHDPDFVDITIAMFVIHEGHLADAVLDGELLGSFDVETGSAMIVTGRAREEAAQFKAERDWQEGIIDELGCYATAADEEGTYLVRAQLRDGRATVVRVGLRDDEDALFRQPKPPQSAKYTEALDAKLGAAGEEGAQPYSPKTTFAVGDRIQHPKFGAGVVTNLLPDAKIEIDFRDGPRMLVHARS